MTAEPQLERAQGWERRPGEGAQRSRIELAAEPQSREAGQRARESVDPKPPPEQLELAYARELRPQPLERRHGRSIITDRQLANGRSWRPIRDRLHDHPRIDQIPTQLGERDRGLTREQTSNLRRGNRVRERPRTHDQPGPPAQIDALIQLRLAAHAEHRPQGLAVAMQVLTTQLLELRGVATRSLEREHEAARIAALGQPIGEHDPCVRGVGIKARERRRIHAPTIARARSQAKRGVWCEAMELEEPTQMLALPAAHSMDTHWFAIDELGHVAMFAAGEVGPVPDPAARHWPEGSNISDDFLPLLRDVDAEALSYEAADIFAVPRASWVTRLLGTSMLDAPPRFDQTLSSVLMQLRAGAGVRERLFEHGLHVLPSREGDYGWGHLGSPLLRELWREGWIIRASLNHWPQADRMGMFCFEHDVEAVEAEDVYRRIGEPRVPLRVHALPTSLRRRLAAAQFREVDFRACELVRASRATDTESG